MKNKIINEIIEIEGGYVNNPKDSGGPTKYGITLAVARKYGYKGAIASLPRSVAFDIYVKRYWDAMNLDIIEGLSPLLAKEIADTGINMGTVRSGEFLQRALNVLNNNGVYYNDLLVDGDIGAKTINALKKYLKIRGKEGEKVLYKVLNAMQGAFYITLAERRTKDEAFVYGWFKNRVD